MKHMIILFIAICFLLVNRLGAQDLRTGLVAYYPLDTDFLDYSGNTLNPTVYGDPQPAPDRHGNLNSAYYFNGVSDYLMLDNDPLICPPYVTISAWFKADGNRQYGRLIEKRHNVPAYPWSSYLLQYSRDPHLATSQMTIEGTRSVLDSDFTADSNSWHLMTATYDGGSYKLYLDGLLSASEARTGNITYTSMPLFIGTCHQNANNIYNFSGALDDIRIYNRALTAGEILALYDLPPLGSTVVEVQYLEGQVQLNWDQVSNAARYKIYSSADPYAIFPDEWILVADDVSSASWLDSTASEEKKFYIVTASN